jgi:hypothetical protein
MGIVRASFTIRWSPRADKFNCLMQSTMSPPVPNYPRSIQFTKLTHFCHAHVGIVIVSVPARNRQCPPPRNGTAAGLGSRSSFPLGGNYSTSHSPHVGLRCECHPAMIRRDFAIEHWAGDAFLVFGHRCRCAGTGLLRITVISTRAGLHINGDFGSTMKRVNLVNCSDGISDNKLTLCGTK